MRVALLLSGGVDSSVSLHLLRRQGHEVTAFYLKIWLEDELRELGCCPWEDDLRYAREVCEAAGVPLEVVSLQRQYHDRVVSSALAELRAGRTPSPDVWCNRRIKFGAFLDHLESTLPKAFDRIASGHYARLAGDGERPELLRGVDPVKDQTYFLYRLDQRQLGRCLFPLGDYRKSQVRNLAEELGLPNRDRRDSQGICFLGKIPYDEFVRSYLGVRRGEIRDVATGERLGEHRGLWFHTIGQRRGLGLSGGPWYVVRKDLEADLLWVAHGSELAEHARGRFRLTQLHWIGDPPALAHSDERFELKLRHGPRLLPARLRYSAPDEIEARLDEPDPGVADGQPAVVYRGERCLGGGVIATRRRGLRSSCDRASSTPRPR